MEGLRARPWLKPEGYVNGGQYDCDGDEDDHSRPWWRRRLRSLYMAAMSFSPSTFRIVISLLLLVGIVTAFIFLPVEQVILYLYLLAFLIGISQCICSFSDNVARIMCVCVFSVFKNG